MQIALITVSPTPSSFQSPLVPFTFFSLSFFPAISGPFLYSLRISISLALSLFEKKTPPDLSETFSSKLPFRIACQPPVIVRIRPPLSFRAGGIGISYALPLPLFSHFLRAKSPGILARAPLYSPNPVGKSSLSSRVCPSFRVQRVPPPLQVAPQRRVTYIYVCVCMGR